MVKKVKCEIIEQHVNTECVTWTQVRALGKVLAVIVSYAFVGGIGYLFGVDPVKELRAEIAHQQAQVEQDQQVRLLKKEYTDRLYACLTTIVSTKDTKCAVKETTEVTRVSLANNSIGYYVDSGGITLTSR